MTTKTPIRLNDIREGDTIREEYKGSYHGRTAVEYVAAHDRHAVARDYAKAHFLLDRPKKVVYAEGTTLYLKDDPRRTVTLSRDHYEGDEWVYAGPSWTRFRAAFYTDVKPAPIHKKGDVLWFRANCAHRHVLPEGQRVTKDYFGGEEFVYVTTRYYPSGGGFYPESLTTIKPDPHPVGAVRWVTQDCDSRWSERLPKGQRLVIEGNEYNNTPIGHVLVSGFRGKKLFLDVKFLSATRVDPTPTTVTVPRDAVEKLRSEHELAARVCGDPYSERNTIRRGAIDAFLKVANAS